MDESQLCPRRKRLPGEVAPTPDTWQVTEAGRVCSYCDSLHPYDFMQYCWESLNNPKEVLFIPTDRPSKYYIMKHECAGVAMLKFYTPHLNTPHYEGGFKRFLYCRGE